MVAAYLEWKKGGGNVGKSQKGPGGARKYVDVPSDWKKTAKRWNWADRVKAFDDSQQKRREIQDWELEQEMHKVRMARHQEQVEAEWQLRTIMLRLLTEMLSYPLRTTAVNVDGKTMIVNPSKWSMKDIPSMTRAMMDLARSSTGMENPRLNSLDHVAELIRDNWLKPDVYEPLSKKGFELEQFAKELLSGGIESEVKSNASDEA